MRKIVVAKCYVEDFWHKCLVKKQNLAKSSMFGQTLGFFDQNFDFNFRVCRLFKTRVCLAYM